MSGCLITPQALLARLGGDVRILDCRSGAGGAGRAAYAAGHIPGAVHTDYAGDGWRARIGNAPGLLPAADHLERLFARLGLDPEVPIIVVPAGQSVSDLAAAARIFWTLELSGLKPEAILDGGMAAWIAAGLPLDSAPAAAAAAPSITPDPTVRTTTAQAVAALAEGQTLFVDARARSFFAGEEKAAEAGAAGHIPGAIHIDYVRCYDTAANRLLPVGELERLFACLPPDRPVVSYCNTGHTAALNWFVLARVLKRGRVTLYDGSMTQWTEDPARPVAVS